MIHPSDKSQREHGVPTINQPIDVRSVSLAILAVLAVIFTLRWASAVFIPIAIAVFLRYALMPIVDWLRRKAAVPLPLGAAFAVILLVGGVSWAAGLLYEQTLEVIDMLPKAVRKFEASMRQQAYERPGAIEKLKEAAAEIDKAAKTAAAPANAPPQPATQPKAESPAAPHVSDFVWIGTWGAVSAAGEAVVVIALAYFLMVAGDTFKRKLVRISGDTLAKKRITVQILHDIDDQVQRYLLVQVSTSALLGLLSWIAFYFLGLPNAAFWGVGAGVLHLIPYVGPTVAIALTGIVAYLEFPDVARVMAVVGTALVLTGVIGLLLVPWLTERVSRVHAVAVFIALLFWGWLWGFWGLLLGVPIVMALKAVCEHVEDLQPIAELLDGSSKKQQVAEDAHSHAT
ncbi:MAG: AI-2E family transporter [Casimicrobiaceae bacterium]